IGRLAGLEAIPLLNPVQTRLRVWRRQEAAGLRCRKAEVVRELIADRGDAVVTYLGKFRRMG
ncbi:hypothetical protein, partial [Acidisphaera rubrifaciens]|uniref:hypothetical protein n=1 Tax=Acidisphaera rubrifaciens TaxID=50715 RepID=UPI00066275EF